MLEIRSYLRLPGGRGFLFCVRGRFLLLRFLGFVISGVALGTAFRRTRVVYFIVSYVIGLTLSPKTLLYWIRSG